MVSVAAGLGLGGAQKAFQASEQLRSREGIEQGKIQEARRKSAVETTKAAVSGLFDKMKENSALFVGATEIQKTKLRQNHLMLEKMIVDLQGGLAGERRGAPNPNADPAAFAAIGSDVSAARLFFESAEDRARAKGAALEATAAGGGAAAAGLTAAATAKAKEAAKPTKLGPGAKALDKITSLAERMTEVDSALKTDPNNQTLKNEQKFLNQELNQDTVASVLVPLIRKVLTGGTLSGNEQNAIDLIKNTSGFQVFMRSIFGGDVLGGSPTAATVEPPTAGALTSPDLNKLSKPMQDLVKQAKTAIKDGTDTNAVRAKFLELGGSEQVFDQLVVGQ